MAPSWKKAHADVPVAGPHGVDVVGAIGAAIALAFAVARLIHHDAAWLVAGFAATAVYLLAAGVPHAMVHVPRDGAGDAGAA